MRVVEIWRDEYNRLYAKDVNNGDTYPFMNYAGAITDSKPLADIVATEMLQDLTNFARFLSGDALTVNFRVATRIDGFTPEKINNG
jgi:hypothetical protein